MSYEEGTVVLLARCGLACAVGLISLPALAQKDYPGKLSFGSAGQGGANHLAGEMFKHAAKIDIVHVPYKGNGPAIIDLISGQIGLMLGSISSLYPHATTKKLRLLAVASPQRSPGAPDTPTFAESGMPGFQAHIKSERAHYGGLIKAIGLKLD